MFQGFYVDVPHRSMFNSTGIEPAVGEHKSDALTPLVLNLRKFPKCDFWYVPLLHFVISEWHLICPENLQFSAPGGPRGGQNLSKTAKNPKRVPLMSKTKCFQS